MHARVVTLFGVLTLGVAVAMPCARADAQALETTREAESAASTQAALPRLDSAEHFTTAQALAAMRRGNPLVAAARAQEQAASYDVHAAGLWTNPVLAASHTRAIVPAIAGAYDPTLGYSTLGVSQLIETANLPGARMHAARYERDALRAEREGLARGLALDVHEAIVGLVESANRLAVYRATAAELIEAHRIVSARVAAGAAPHYDLSRMSIALAQSRADVADAEADLTAARVELDVAVGPEATTLHGLPDYDLYRSGPLAPLDALLTRLGVTRSDLVAASAREREAEWLVSVARRSVFQGITLSAGVAVGAYNPLQATPQGLPPEVDATLGVTLPLPFVDRGQGTIPAAQARQTARNELFHAIAVSAAQRLASAYREAMQRRDALDRYVASGAASSVGMLREAEAGYRQGRLQVLDLVDAYVSVRDAQLRIVTLAHDARMAEIAMWRAAGMVPE
jgi:cobalt-zinc-cadmium efflux system outer membrane protein